MSKNLPKANIYLVAILTASTIVTLISIALTYRNSARAAEDSLKLQALGIAVSLEASMKDSEGSGVKSYELKHRKNIFKEIITEGRWEGIAFIALYDKRGATLLHSNENLIGRQVQDTHAGEAAETGKPVYGYLTLGTGEQVFLLNFPLYIKDETGTLRLALRTYPIEENTRQARLHALSMFLVIGILWLVGGFFIKALKRSDELKKLILERERLAVIGEMASVLAHEIRNPLGSIKGFAQYMKEQGAEGRPLNTDSLDIIISESGRLDSLTEDLLMYAKPADIRLEEFDVSGLVEEIVRGRSADDIDIKVLVPDSLKIKSDRDKLKQVLINIIQNSVDALGDKGILDIGAGTVGNKITIIVKDNGCGMDKEAMANAFKPFFTTKARGTGLGLAIVDKLVKSLGGTIELQSELGKGTVFKVTIPIEPAMPVNRLKL